MIRCRYRSFIEFAACCFIIAASLVTASGCDSTESESTVEEHSIDPHYQSPDTLIDYYNTLNSSEPVNIQEALGLFYAENQIQRQYINIARNMMHYAELDYEVYKRFGESMDPRRPDSHMLMPTDPARITTRESQRAEAIFVNNDGDEETIYLVQIGGEWRISGYTLEYNFDWDETITDLDAFARMAGDLSTAARAVLRDIRNGTIHSLEGARKAYAEALVATLMPPLDE